MIALIDYHAGNLTSVRKALAAVGAAVFVPERPPDLQSAAGIIVPGVGHFGATRTLDREWVDAITAHIGEGRPLLGICLGMQWLFEASEEAPDLTGLGVMSGRCMRLGAVRLKPDTTSVGLSPDTAAVDLPPNSTDHVVGLQRNPGVRNPDVRNPDVRHPDVRSVRLQADLKVPHVGWNTLALKRDSWIADGVPDQAQVYFTHSYVAPITGDVVAVTEHGDAFAAIVERGHIAGVQFHPEKSGDVGLRILRNFVARTQ